MSWVLILVSSEIPKPPAVVGGYQTREEAEQAGELATAYDVEKYGIPYFTRYSVIPGAACSGPIGATHVKTSYESVWQNEKFELKVTREIHKWPK